MLVFNLVYGTATGGVYSGTGVTDDETEKLIPLILLRLVLEHIQ
jgi:hypothetical protein